MNQILYNKKRNKIKYIFKVQFILSIIVSIILIILLLNSYNNDENLENISEVIDRNMKLTSIYKAEKQNTGNNYFGKIYIEKIGIEYVIFNKLSDALLKISPCRFYGVNIGEEGNIGIAGHNYNDDRFFGRLDELKSKDKIHLVDMNGKKYEYTVFDIFETDENDTSVLKKTKRYELTLVTCNNANNKRIIVKAYRKEY